MRPKIEAALDFLNNGGKMVTITNPEHLIAALDGEAGTKITK
jgi:carbamate kinase